MKTYKAIFDNNKVDGVFGISLVKSPAMEGLFVALKKQQKEIKLKKVNEDERILIGLVLEPNKPIYRFNEETKEEFNIVFDEATIKDLAHNFYKGGFQKNSTLEHETKINDVTFVESWIVEDSEKDKSAVYGFSYPKGSWIATMKVDSDEIWNDYVKTGKIKGFSIDAMLDLKEINFNNQTQMAKENNLIDVLKVALGLTEKQDVKLAEIKTKDGELTIMYEGENLEVGVPLFVMNGDERVALLEGEYITEMGVLVVDAEGKLMEIKEDMPTEAPTEAPTELEHEPKGKTKEDLENAIKSILVKYHENTNEKLKAFETKLSEVVKENETLKEQVLEFSKEPSAKPISAPTQVVAKTRKQRLINSLK